jgi:hypothetical protein
MDRSKIVAVVTGAIAIALSLAYLLIVQLLDFRGEMVPAPIGQVGTLALAAIQVVVAGALGANRFP